MKIEFTESRTWVVIKKRVPNMKMKMSTAETKGHNLVERPRISSGAKLRRKQGDDRAETHHIFRSLYIERKLKKKKPKGEGGKAKCAGYWMQRKKNIYK